MGLLVAFRGKISIVGNTDFGHSSEFRGFRGQSLLGGYNCISSMWLSVGNESLGHYSEVGCFSEEVLLIECFSLIFEP